MEESDEEDGKVQKKVSHDAALAHVEGLIQYLEEEDDASLCDKIVIKKTSIPNKEEVFQCKKKKKKNRNFYMCDIQGLAKVSPLFPCLKIYV